MSSSFVIRLGFEPKTHSLEGCCSIQLSYRTRPACRGEATLRNDSEKNHYHRGAMSHVPNATAKLVRIS